MSIIEVETCQICKRTVTLENTFLIFDHTCIHFLEEIQEISGVDFKGLFNQPWCICMQCYISLLTAQEFRRNCIEAYKHQTTNQKSNEILLERVTGLPPEIFSDIIENEIAILPLEILNEEINIKNKTDSEKSSTEKTEESINEKKKLMKISEICEICGNVFQTKRNFALHRQRHTNNKPFECELCLNKFHTNAELKCHMRRHTGEKPYACKYCHRKFSDYSTHKKHERTHTNDRPFSCHFCGKAFTTTFVLKNHILSHTGKRSFKCKVCDKSFIHPSHLRSHLKSLFHLRSCKRAEEES